ncbi:MAG: hypothetical protein NVSMB58_35730 [Terriglobales bacterium]
MGVYGYDNLVVLKTASSPAVLLEAGIIANRTDELILVSLNGRQQIARSVLNAVEAICSKN